MAPKKVSTRANPQNSPVASVSNPEQILRRGKSLPTHTSKTKGNLLSKSQKSYLKSTESSSSKIVSDKSIVIGIEEAIDENIYIAKPIVSTPEDVLLEEVLDSNVLDQSPKTHKGSQSNSSVESFHSQKEEKFLDVHTSFLAVEHLLEERFAKGEENLAKQLAEFYIASQATSSTSEKYWPFKLNSPIVEKPI